MRKLEFGMTSHQFASVINENAEELGTVEKIEFETMTPNHLATTLNEQLIKVDSNKSITYSTSELADTYNKEVGEYEPPTPVVSQIVEVGKTYNLTFKDTGMNEETLNLYNMQGDVMAVTIVNLDEGANELCRIGIALDSESEYATVSTNWTSDIGPCDAYLYDNMYNAIQDMVVTAEDHSVKDTTSYTGAGWYHVEMVEGSIMDLSTLKITIEKLETVPTFSNLEINSISDILQTDVKESIDLTGLFSIYEEVENT